MKNELFELTSVEIHEVTGGVPFGALPLIVVVIDPDAVMEMAKENSK